MPFLWGYAPGMNAVSKIINSVRKQLVNGCLLVFIGMWQRFISLRMLVHCVFLAFSLLSYIQTYVCMWDFYSNWNSPSIVLYICMYFTIINSTTEALAVQLQLNYSIMFEIENGNFYVISLGIHLYTIDFLRFYYHSIIPYSFLYKVVRFPPRANFYDKWEEVHSGIELMPMGCGCGEIFFLFGITILCYPVAFSKFDFFVFLTERKYNSRI